MYQHLTECKVRAENVQISFCFCKTCICLKILENIQISVNMIDRLDITDEYYGLFCAIQSLFLRMRSNGCIPINSYRILPDNTYMEKYGLTTEFLCILLLGVSPNIHEPQLTPVCTGFLENMANSWYSYFLTGYIIAF